MFSADTYKERRNKLKAAFQKGILFFPGNSYSPMNYKDNVYPFRQDSSFLYFFGIDQANLNAIIDLDEDKTIIFGNELSVDDIVWTGPLPSLKKLAEKVGVLHTQPTVELDTYLQKTVSAKRPVHYLPVYRAALQIKMASWLNASIDDIKNGHSPELIQAVYEQRAYKSEEEVEQISQAINTTCKMHIAAMRIAKPGMLEANLAGLVKWQAIAGGGDLAYGVILTINGQTLHNHHHHNIMKEGDLVLGDFGAETAMHYAGDITRTFPVSATFSSRQSAIYNTVLSSQLAAIDALKPGITYKEVHLLAARTIVEGLKDVGLMKGNVEDAVASGAHALFFPHGLGHMMGLDVHDMENFGEDLVGYGKDAQRSDQFGLAYLRLGRKLETGFVLTVEPGIYFIPELIDQWKAKGTGKDFIDFDKLEDYKNFGGIRIEDDLLITENGSKLLGDPIPKTVKEIEAIRAMAF